MFAECSPERTVSLAEPDTALQVAYPHHHHHPPLCPEEPPPAVTMPVVSFHPLPPPDPYPDLPEDLSKNSTTSRSCSPHVLQCLPAPSPVEEPRVPLPLRDDPDSLYNLTQLAEVSLLHPELHGCPDCGKR